ncbi:MAG TPA: hypothetical protein VHK88_07295 [Aquihabitans sp.]|jgi:hypothetical protein|nr:hypothetical protein [Aquihabitans sp.]
MADVASDIARLIEQTHAVGDDAERLRQALRLALHGLADLAGHTSSSRTVVDGLLTGVGRALEGTWP